MNKRIPILVQLIVGFTLIMLTVIIVTFYFSYRNSAYVLLRTTHQYLNESVRQMSGKLDVALKEYDKFTQMVEFNSMLQDYLKKIDAGQQPAQSKYEIERFISEQSRFLGGESLTVIHITDNKEGYYTANTSISLLWNKESQMKQQFWYPYMVKGKGDMLWFTGDVWTSGKTRAVIGARQLNNWETLDKLGNLFVAFPVDQLGRMIGQVDLGRSGKVQVIDQFGQIVFSTNGKESGKKLTESFLTELKNNTGRMFEWTIDNQPTYIVQSGSTYSGWTVIAYIGAKEAFSELDKMGNSTMIIVIFGIFAALLFSTFLSWTISRPIRLLAKRLSRLNKGVLMPYQGKTSNKEVAILHESFNQMVEHLNQTIKDLSDKQISERQAQLVALKAQIRPHFLYNSLNTIYWSLINDDRAKEAQMVLTLSDLMRYSIQPGSEMVTVSEDVKQLQRFIEISKLRYGDKLQTEVEVDDDALELKMMKLLLQPIVENAITHGLEPVKGPWLIRIRIFRKDQLIHFVVEDNGIGMTKAQMLKVLEFHHDAEKETIMHSGIGLANLNYRVGIIYGKEYGLKLSMSELGGLKVEVSLPLALEDNREQSPDRFEKGDVK